MIAAQRSRKKLADVLATIGEGLWEWDLASGTFRHNGVWCRMLGHNVDALEHALDGFLALVHPEDRDEVASALEGGLRDGCHTIEYRLRHADGDPIWVRDRGGVVESDPDGRPLLSDISFTIHRGEVLGGRLVLVARVARAVLRGQDLAGHAIEVVEGAGGCDEEEVEAVGHDATLPPGALSSPGTAAHAAPVTSDTITPVAAVAQVAPSCSDPPAHIAAA